HSHCPRVHHAVGRKAQTLLVLRRNKPIIGLAGQHQFKVLTPAIGHHDIANTEVGIDAPGNAAEHNMADIKMVYHKLRGHGGVDHTDATEEEHDGLVSECASGKCN